MFGEGRVPCLAPISTSAVSYVINVRIYRRRTSHRPRSHLRKEVSACTAEGSIVVVKGKERVTKIAKIALAIWRLNTRVRRKIGIREISCAF